MSGRSFHNKTRRQMQQLARRNNEDRDDILSQAARQGLAVATLAMHLRQLISNTLSLL